MVRGKPEAVRLAIVAILARGHVLIEDDSQRRLVACFRYLWLDDGLIVYTQGRDETQRHEFLADPEGTSPGYPIVVIVNEGSASA